VEPVRVAAAETEFPLDGERRWLIGTCQLTRIVVAGASSSNLGAAVLNSRESFQWAGATRLRSVAESRLSGGLVRGAGDM
jgi:hypothetical protein